MDPSRISRRFIYLVYLLRPGHRGRYSAKSIALHRFQFSIRRLLVGVLLASVAVAVAQNYLARIKFANTKSETIEELASSDWGAMQQEALLDAMAQVTYDTRFAPKLAFSSIHKMLVDAKFADGRSGWHMLFVRWIDLKNRVDTIRITLKSGDHVDHQFRKPYDIMKFFRGGQLYLAEIGLGDGTEIESIALVSEGLIVSEAVSPMHSPE